MATGMEKLQLHTYFKHSEIMKMNKHNNNNSVIMIENNNHNNSRREVGVKQDPSILSKHDSWEQ